MNVKENVLTDDEIIKERRTDDISQKGEKEKVNGIEIENKKQEKKI